MKSAVMNVHNNLRRTMEKEEDKKRKKIVS